MTVFFLLAVLIFSGSCTKKEIPGPKGDPGTDGIGGNSSITSTTVFTITSSQWKPDSLTTTRKVTLPFAQITNAVLEEGAVSVFIQPDMAFSDPSWTELPFVRGDLFMQFGFSEGNLHLEYLNIEGGWPPVPSSANYRLVIVTKTP